MTTLTVHDLSFDYPNRPVLQDIDFSVSPGSICGLLGPNASGKTTLFKCMNGILAPHKGHVAIAGRQISELSRQAIAGLMAVVPQHTAVAFSFTGLQMVVMGKAAGLKAWEKPGPKDVYKAKCAMDELEISHLAQRPYNELSGGEKQMVLLARAIFQDPLALLLDEPTAPLDFRNQHRIMEMVCELTHRKKLITVVSLHDPNLAARYCSQMVMLKQGRVYGQGTADQVFTAEALTRVYGIDVDIAENSHGKYLFIPCARHQGLAMN